MTDIADKRILTKERTELHFFDEVYRVYVVFLICSEEDAIKFCRGYGLKDVESLNFAGSSGYTIVFDEDTCDSDSRATLVWLRKRHLPCLVHELAHLTMITFGQKDIPIRAENQETFAYYIEHWVKRITEVWRIPRTKAVGEKAKKKGAKNGRINTLA